MIDPHKIKYYPFYWGIVREAQKQTVATRHQVGAIVVTSTGMISPGWNGMPSGMDNCCESKWITEKTPQGNTVRRRKSNPEVIHAERNAIDKMTRQGIPTQGSVLFVSRAPCFECGKALQGLGLKAIYYAEDHDDMRGVDLLRATGTPTIHKDCVEAASDLSVI